MNRPTIVATVAGFVCVLVPLLGCEPGFALTLDFPGVATSTATKTIPLTQFGLPVGPFDGTMQVKAVTGRIQQAAWRISPTTLTTFDLLSTLMTQITSDGFAPVFSCETQTCGGFDFRFGLDVLAEPDMHIDLGDFRYVSAERTTAAGVEYLGLIISRAPGQLFVQLDQISPAGSAAPILAPATKSAEVTPNPDQAPSPQTDAALTLIGADIGTRLQTGGSQALDDLVFASGRAVLEPGDYASLDALAAWLLAHPTARIALVGHTDASGSLESNISLSRKRAESVRQVMLFTYRIPPAQIAAEGVGYLSPRATNQTEAGRTQNRRVEVMLTSTP